MIVDDEFIEASVIGAILTDHGFDISIQNHPRKAMDLAQKQSFALIISDLRMPGMDGLELLQELRRIDPDVAVIIMTAFATVGTAVEAMRKGAFDYIVKPFSKDQLLISVERAIKTLEIERHNRYLKTELGLGPGAMKIVGNSPSMRELFQMISKVAQDDKTTVLIEGETGTGKDLVARAIHEMSPRQNEPFIVVNCAAIPEGLMESEMFGHEKGAFTGAVMAKPGRFELADRGTLFLDEVAEMSPAMQSKLLRVLQTREFERVGGRRTQHVNVRVIAATNTNLQEHVRAGRFREDLFYRLNVVPLKLPALRERHEDIPALVEYILMKFHGEGKRLVRVSPDALEALKNYNYPGNVRELENILERAIVVSDGQTITPRELHLSDAGVTPVTDETSTSSSFKIAANQARDETERALLTKTLEQTGWNRVRAAKILGIDYKTIRRKIRRYNLTYGENDSNGKGLPHRKQ
jgi:DNA-binding NtrC family response regulator